MKNLKKLCFILSAGSIAALSLSACSDDPATTGGTAGAGTAGAGTAGAGTAGAGTAGAGTAGAGTAGAGTAGKGGSGGSGGAATAGGGAGGNAGAGGKAGAGGGGAGGAAGSGGAGGAPSADCKKWCQGAMGVVTFCAGSGLADNVNTEAKCIAHCTAPEAAGVNGLACWNKHLQYAIDNKDNAAMKTAHCGHASGAPAPKNGDCNETK